ncbi:MAG TPA: sigma-70 family RNA polymerase sigma factor [Eubacteriales bacterium]|nr:sigma-70 family RNA polymerase sigma factor [Clostridia bacterium]HRV72660.1 sigma-70 family RNA polymerase sigma factor [Eubacteriales bacterium]
MPSEDFAAKLQRAKDGDAEAENELLTENMPLVYAISKRYYNRGADADDLKQLGAIGLLKAIRRFDPSFGVCFSTYAVPLIAGEIKRFLRDDGMVKYSRSQKELAYKLKRLQDSQENICIEDAARLLNVTPQDAAAALGSAESALSLDAPTNEDGMTISESLGRDDWESVNDSLFIKDMVNALPQKERLLIELRFFSELTQKEAANRLGISQAQASRLERRVLTLMSNAVHNLEPPRT